MHLCEKVSARLREAGFACRTVTLKIRLKGFRTYTRSVTMPESTNLSDILYNEAKDLYNKFDREGLPVRLIGVKASNISRHEEATGLFDDTGPKKSEKVHKAIDTIRNKFGDGYICRATGMRRPAKGNSRI
jgi:DNA polymerase-4